MFHTDLRKLFVNDSISPNVTPIYEKDPGHTVYVVNEGGDGITGINKPRRAVIPMVPFLGSQAYIAAAVNEFIACLFACNDAIENALLLSDRHSQMERVLTRLKVGLRDQGGLAAIVGNRAVVQALDDVSDVPLYISPIRMPYGFAFGIPCADKAGRIARSECSAVDLRPGTIGLISFGHVLPIQILSLDDEPEEGIQASPRPIHEETRLTG